MTCDVGPRVARVASPFYSFLKFFKIKRKCGGKAGIYPSNPSNPSRLSGQVGIFLTVGR